MIFSARSRKQFTNRPRDSNSKDSKNSNVGKPQFKIYRKTQTELKLIQSINLKFEKSKIKSYRYVTNQQMHQTKDNQSDNSQKSQKMEIYANLIGQKFVHLKQYHNMKVNSQSQNKYLIRTKFSQNKKSIKTESDNYFMSKIQFLPEKKIQKDINFNDRLFAKNQNLGAVNYQYRIVHSGQKDQRLRKNLNFQYLSHQKNSKFYKRTITQQGQNRSRLHYLRKQKKSPSHNVIF